MRRIVDSQVNSVTSCTGGGTLLIRHRPGGPHGVGQSLGRPVPHHEGMPSGHFSGGAFGSDDDGLAKSHPFSDRQTEAFKVGREHDHLGLDHAPNELFVGQERRQTDRLVKLAICDALRQAFTIRTWGLQASGEAELSRR